MPELRLEQMKQAVGAQEVIETHISWVLLTDEDAIKIKKPLKNDFLDYAALESRKALCEKELQLNRRYAPSLYVGLVRFVDSTHGIKLEDEETASSRPVLEYGVKMHRFPDANVLKERLKTTTVTLAEIREFATSLAAFHAGATVVRTNEQSDCHYGNPAKIHQDASDNLLALQSVVDDSAHQMLSTWTQQTFTTLEHDLVARQQNGFIRECHGDLHAGNVVYWQDRWTPFDGIEFNESFRWIDVLSDLGFLAMDLQALSHEHLANAFVSQYLEETGDYEQLKLLTWYMVYRALVRAKVAELARRQQAAGTEAFERAVRDRDEHVQLALQLAQPEKPRLWITYGLSGSGKSTAARKLLTEQGAIQLRSDVERKRLRGLNPRSRPTQAESSELYSDDMHSRTYERLVELSHSLLAAGFSVIVDASFLKHGRRLEFRNLAEQLGVRFYILACEANRDVLAKRLEDRQALNQDPSDADVSVLDQQLRNYDSLQAEEIQFVWRNN